MPKKGKGNHHSQSHIGKPQDTDRDRFVFCVGGMTDMATKPRYKNGALRRKYRARFKARGDRCKIAVSDTGAITATAI